MLPPHPLFAAHLRAASTSESSRGKVNLSALSDAQNAALGGVAGIIEVAINQPLVSFKNKVQQGQPLSLHPRAMYAGLLASAANTGGITALQFLGTGAVLREMLGADAGTRAPTNREMIVGGSIAGALSGPVCSFLELVMIQQQQFGGSAVGTPMRVLKSYGVARGLCRGMSPAIAREAVFTAGLLGELLFFLVCFVYVVRRVIVWTAFGICIASSAGALLIASYPHCPR
jgi:hypothetical protein